MPRALYLTQRDARDIRNIDELLSSDRSKVLQDKHFQGELWLFFRRLRVSLDKVGNKTKAWQKVRKPMKDKQA